MFRLRRFCYESFSEFPYVRLKNRHYQKHSDPLTLEISFSYSVSPKCFRSQPARCTANVKYRVSTKNVFIYTVSCAGHGELSEQNGPKNYRSDVWIGGSESCGPEERGGGGRWALSRHPRKVGLPGGEDAC